MEAPVKGKRPYDTKLRQEQAGLTRQRILEAARRLLIAAGYSQVTMQDVAGEAGVAYQTLYAQFGSKLQLALELCASEFPHVGQAVGKLAAARSAGDPERWLRTIGKFARFLYEPCADVLRFMRESGDADLLGRYREIERGRLEQLADIGPQLQRAGKLRDGLTPSVAVDIVWSLTGPETYAQLVLDRGWTPDHFERWLDAALVGLILSQ